MNALLVAAFFALVFAVLDRIFHWIPYRTIAQSTRSFWRWQVRKAGIKAIYPRSDAQAGEPLRSILQDAKDRDEIFMVGRTQKGLLQDNEQLIMEALGRGAILRLLFLDQRVLTNRGPGQQVDLRSLRLPNAYRQLVDDVGDAEAKLRVLIDKCLASGVPGSLLVYRTGVLVQSSVVVLAPREQNAPMRLLYDFSFGTNESDKFVQYYRSAQRNSADDFCNRLHMFYSSLFDPDVSSFAYELSYPIKEIQKVATERITKLIAVHDEIEKIRNNDLVHVVPAAALVFRSLSGNTNVPAPLSAQIELTNECSTKCTHCFRFSPSSTGHMDIALAEEILDQLHDFGVRTITFSGGEPTRHSAFGRLLRHAALEKKLAVGVLSNGVNVTDEDLEEIYKHARWLRLSIDGSPTVYGDIRRVFSSGKDAFEEVRSTIQRFVRLNNSAPRCKLSICYTIQKHNADDVPEMIKWVRSLSIPNGDESLTFKFAHGSNGFLCTAKQLRTLYSEVLNNPEFHRAANLPYLRWFLDRQSSMSDVAKGRPTESLYLQQPTRCFTPHLFTLIDPQGDVYPCCFLFEDNQGYTEEALAKRRLHCVGNLRTKTFRQLWDSTEYQQIRGELAIINPKTAKYAACGECTRHCNHNQGLSQLYAEYSGLHAAGGDADSVMKEIIKNTSGNDVWL